MKFVVWHPSRIRHHASTAYTTPSDPKEPPLLGLMLSYFSILWFRLKSGLMALKRSSLDLALLPILILIAVGTLSYTWLEGWSLLDSLYATIITVTTVGYGDLSPQTPGGRIFAVFFTLSAIGLAGYAVTTLAAIVIDYETNRVQRGIEDRRMKRLADLTNHMIICGASIVGQRVANEFSQRHEPFILIEADEATLKYAMLWLHEGYVSKLRRQWDLLQDVEFEEEKLSVAELADELNILYLLENPTDEKQLRRAGIDRAYGIVTALDDDRDNISVVLSARHMAKQLGNSNLRIVARVLNEWNMRRLYLAGADKVIAPNIVGGFQIASSMLSPEVADFWEQMLFFHEHNIRFDDLRIIENPEWAGQTVAALKQRLGQLVVAIKRADGYLYAPDPDERLRSDDVLIVIGPILDLK